MARRPRKSSRSSRARQAQSETKRKVEILRKKGLIGRGEYRGKPSGSTYKLLRKYSDVVEGKAVVVTPRTKLIPKHMRKQLRERNGRVVVPKTSGTVSTVVKREGRKTVIKRTVRTRTGELQRETVTPPMAEPDRLSRGKIYKVTMPNWRGDKAIYFNNKENMDDYFQMGSGADIARFADIAIVPLAETPFA